MIKKNLADFLAIIIMFWVLNPISYIKFNSIFLLVLSLLWIMLVQKKVCFLKTIIIASLYPIILIIYSFLGISLLEKTTIFIPLWVYMGGYYLKKEHSFFKKYICNLFILYFSIIHIYSIYRLTSNPDLSRLIAGADISEANYFLGGYNTVYCTMLFDLCVICKLLFFRLKFIEKVYLSVFLFLSFVFLLKAQYTIALLLFILGFFIYLFVYANIYYRFIIVVLFLTFLIFFLFLLEYKINIFYLIADFFPKGMIHNRFLQIGDLFSVDRYFIDSNGFENRVSLYKISIDTFFKNPIFGIGYFDIDKYVHIGNHSSYLDSLARYGVIGGGSFILGRIIYFHQLNKFHSLDNRKILICVQLIYHLLSLINQVHTNDFTYLIVIIIPIFLKKTENEINKKGCYSC